MSFVSSKVGTPTPTTELIVGSFACNGEVLKEVNRYEIFPTRTPCSGISYLIGNDSYEAVLSGDRKEIIHLYGPMTFSGYLNGIKIDENSKTLQII